jgi:pyruvate dehydrogenase E2 component (dihydrolipoamide acetyltransferase)
MPSLGADMEHGTVVAWKVKPGDRVKRGDIVAEVETEKGVFDIEATSDGVVAELLVTPGTRTRVGAALARFGERPTTGAPVTPPPSPPAARRVSPAARRLASERGIDLTTIAGSGPDGAIVLADVERLRPTGAAAPPTVAVPPPDEAARAMRHAVAAAVSRSKREIPHYYLSADIDLGKALAWLSTRNAQRSVDDRTLPAVLLLKSVASALRSYPDLNGVWTDGALHVRGEINLGVAISLRGGGLIAPAIHDSDKLSLDALMAALRDVVKRARAGGLRSSEMTDATITVSNLGEEGVTSLLGVISPPQVALVGFGAITERPWVEQGKLCVTSVVTMTLSADHRATDGHYGGRFLREVARLLQTPEAL